MNLILFSVVSCACIGALCGLLGTYLIIRRMALFGDMVGHAVLPGICLGFVFSGFEKNPIGLFLGALASAILSGFFLEFLSGKLKIKSDASMAIVLSGFYAIGTMILTWINQSGFASQAGLNKFLLGQASAVSIQDLKLIITIFMISIGYIYFFYNQLKVSCFDYTFSKVCGLNPNFYLTILTLLISITVIVSLQAVGAILVSALLIIPAATSAFLFGNLHFRILSGMVFGALSGAIGAIVSSKLNIPTGPSIILSASPLFVLAIMCSPQKGIISLFLRKIHNNQKRELEHLLKSIFYFQEINYNEFIPIEKVMSKLSNQEKIKFDKILKRSISNNLVIEKDGALILSFLGKARAFQVVRNHRLWELYLVKKMDFKLDHVHEDAEIVEHILTTEIVQKLEESLNSPHFDPHGKKIPSILDLRNYGVPGY